MKVKVKVNVKGEGDWNWGSVTPESWNRARARSNGTFGTLKP